MVAHKPLAATQIKAIPVPLGAEFSGRYADDLAWLAYGLMMRTSASGDYQRGFWIPFSQTQAIHTFGHKWRYVKNSAISEHGEIFEFNDHYSNFEGNTFPKSIRLSDRFRHGYSELYTLKRARSKAMALDDLDKVSTKLVSHFDKFHLDTHFPFFENPWQAFTYGRILNRDWYAGRCDFGRFHSNFTSFKHRHRIRHDKPLTALDIVACQPLILGALVARVYGLTPDVREWLRLCAEEDLYTVLGQIMGLNDRGAIKLAFLTCIFEKRGNMLKMPEYAAIQSAFPTIAKHLDIRKRDFKYQAVAHDCQRLESSLLIDKLVPKLGKIPVITIHDEIILPSQHVGKIRGIVDSLFQDEGMVPQFKTKEIF
jgi:hypothetical protein